MPGFTAAEILDQLDRATAGFSFPTLDNGYIYPVDVRLTAYGDDARWALVFEHIGFWYRLRGAMNSVYAFGPALREPPAQTQRSNLVTTPEAEWQSDTGMSIRAGLRAITIRDTVVRLTAEDIAPAKHNDGSLVPGGLPIPDFLRRLLPLCQHLFHAPDAELRALVRPEVPQLLQLLEWEHSDAVHDVLPSHTECFPMLARALVSGDASEYAPTCEPNTHWSNWPEGGTL